MTRICSLANTLSGAETLHGLPTNQDHLDNEPEGKDDGDGIHLPSVRLRAPF